MKYALVVNNKVTSTQTGIKPIGWVEVVKKWEVPSDYPSNFYVATSNIPRLTVVDNEVHETWGFVLKSVESIKYEIYQSQKEERQRKQLGEFFLGDITIVLKDREDSLIISSLPETDTRYKVSQGNWVALTASDIIQLKNAHGLHVQAAYDWEMNANNEVDLLVTLDDLVKYITPTEET
jgi:hypothetical protein